MKKLLFAMIILCEGHITSFADNIKFADSAVKNICVSNWDTDGDGELSKIEAATVTDIGTKFSSNNNITTFDELQYFTGLTYIPTKAFYGCSNLASIILPEGVTGIGESAFYSCSSLTSINLPNNLKTINQSVFRGCTQIGSIVLPSSIIRIPEYLFYDCTNLSSVTALSEIREVGGWAFTGTEWSKSGTENGIKYLGNFAAAYDGTTKDVAFKATTSGIADGLFYDAESLGKVVLPSGITDIPCLMFSWSNVEEVVIPKNINLINYNSFRRSTIGTLTIEDSEEILKVSSHHDNVMGAFEYSSIGTAIISRPLQNYAINNVYEPDRLYAHPFGDADIEKAIVNKNMNIADLFNGCRITSVVLPDDLTEIGDNAFKYYNNGFFADSKLPEIEIPDNVQSIGKYAFYGRLNLSSITLPSSLLTIGDYAFYRGDNLKSVTVRNTTPLTITSKTFSNRTNATLYVPAGSKEGYTAATYWKDFKEIVEIPKCEAPVISFASPTVTCTSATEGAKFHYVIDANNSSEGDTNDDGSFSISALYTITVYAYKDGYDNSDPTTISLDLVTGAMTINGEAQASTKGDINHDGKVNISDVTTLVDIILGK